MGVREHLDEAWTYYLTTERERLSSATPGGGAADQGGEHDVRPG